MRTRLTLFAAAILLLLPAGAAGQARWDSPMFATPRPEAGYGVYIMEPAGADLGLMVTWRSAAISGVRLRFGIADAPGDDIAVLLGGDYSALLRGAGPDFPLEVGWLLGLGLGYSDFTTLSIPFGASFGLPVQTEDIRFTPFVTPRVIVDAFLGDRPPDGDRTDLDFAVDLGLDVGITGAWGIRFAVTPGGRSALGLGLVF